MPPTSSTPKPPLPLPISPNLPPPYLGPPNRGPSGINLPEDFAGAAAACLAFSRERPDLLGMLSKRDIEVVVEKGMPFLFKNGDDSGKRMRSFLGSGDSNTKYGLKNHVTRCCLDRRTHNLRMCLGPGTRPGNIEALGCIHALIAGSFMNFARNVKCLECEEARPKRQLTGGECDFFNYARNMVCLRCDCKRPGEVLFGTTNSGSALGYGNGSNTNKADVDSRLAANEEKAQRWFSKLSQLDSSSDMSSAIADEDFPEIIPLRKGVNRFVVSTRKTPLERRLANAQYRRNLGNDGILRYVCQKPDELKMDKSDKLEMDDKSLSSSASEQTGAVSGRIW
ncbi:hypothetical protein GH714_022086 [Hevea brasiliensis]|uniref:Uncharacterized protein n=1 Tax=Hevea brasiliensis TaxID=3981 RepID=A0A6A6M2V3_HEVBR|nr:hypothetical protein GH714_022086 [Hevea brasiliensis]